MNRRLCYAILFFVALCGVSGCATTGTNPKDPYEEFNRAMFSINEGIDTIAKPVAQGYETITPRPIRIGISNFFGNIGDIWISINNFLQGKVGDGFSDIGRFLVNSTVGIAGLFDVASEIGLEKHAEDFGQTLGKWGVDDGPYFYWPVLGPRTARDTFGGAIDIAVDPLRRVHDIPARNVMLGTRVINQRAALLPAEKVMEQAAFDKYNYIRDIYLKARRIDVNDEE